MANFHDQTTSAHGTIRAVTGVDVTYQRDTDSVGLIAVPGMTKFQVTDYRGMVIEHESRDFIVSVDDLSLFPPQRGDRIQQGNNLYEVMRPDGSDDIWKFSDAARTVVRVHTKFIGNIASAGAFDAAFSTAFDVEGQ